MEIESKIVLSIHELCKCIYTNNKATIISPDEIVLNGIFSRPILRQIIEKLDCLEEIQKQNYEHFKSYSDDYYNDPDKLGY